jgi:hypothetical protein
MQRQGCLICVPIQVMHWGNVLFSWTSSSRISQPLSIIHQQGQPSSHHVSQLDPQSSSNWALSFLEKEKSSSSWPASSVGQTIFPWWIDYSPHQDTSFSLTLMGPSSEPLRDNNCCFSAAERPTTEPCIIWGESYLGLLTVGCLQPLTVIY